MKVHCINILLFAVPLNILINDQRNHKSTTQYTPKIPITRLLCECDLYIPNYDNDPEMKSVMDNFNKQTQQRFHEYDDRMKEKRMQCTDKCDKEIQNIILKDKLEKELTEKFSTLQTDIQSDAIPTCIYEKSLADKMEKGSLRCGSILGAAMPELGSIGGTLVYAAAQSSAAKVGVSKAIELMGNIYNLGGVRFIDWMKLINVGNYNHRMSLVGIVNKVNNMCPIKDPEGDVAFCFMEQSISRRSAGKFVQIISEKAGDAAMKAREAASGKFSEMTNVSVIFSDPVVISAIVVVTIALILLIIYFILRYRRKKKMKKKLQYIKLLNE
ncbi:rifin PIR protein,putative [Plasmodium sp. DRC-Itaito]|nr:rifin PIR protein,putative [Plasmodium sp. DRC-Itaito]